MMEKKKAWVVALMVGVASCSISSCAGFGSQCIIGWGAMNGVCRRRVGLMRETRMEDHDVPIAQEGEPVGRAAGLLDGKRVLPVVAVTSGISEGDKVAAVYAVLNKSYKRNAGEGWEHCEYIGVTRNLAVSLESHAEEHGGGKCAHIRAVSYSFPKRSVMEELARDWKALVRDAGGTVADKGWPITDEDAALNQKDLEERESKKVELSDAASYLFDEDDDDDMDYAASYLNDMDISMQIASQQPSDTVEPTAPPTIVSPFSSQSTPSTPSPTSSLPFTVQNIDKVLEEVRPYLISDGGNISVQNIDQELRTVYVVLEGACGSCPSSTVTMKMGVERVLKEHFPDLNEIVQVEDLSTPTTLELEAVQNEVNRLAPAITAMGGVVEVKDVDPNTGVATILFRGSNKVRYGLELAIRDLPLVNHVQFVSE